LYVKKKKSQDMGCFLKPSWGDLDQELSEWDEGDQPAGHYYSPVEQNARIALKYAHRGYVLETGHVVLEGAAKELAQNEKIKKAYLGQ
jgi:hypothetical protein